MNKFFRNGLFMLAAGALAASCADYNVTDEFRAQPDPSYVEPYNDLGPVKSYIDRAQYPNLVPPLGLLTSTSRNWHMLQRSPTSTMSHSAAP